MIGRRSPTRASRPPKIHEASSIPLPQSTSQWRSRPAELVQGRVQARKAGIVKPTIDGAQWSHIIADIDGPDSTSQHPSEAPQPQGAAAAMMHGMSMAPASSHHGGCPTIAENQEFAPCMPPPGMTLMQHDVIVPNPGYKIAANLWDLNIQSSARAPSPLATFLRPIFALTEKRA